MDALFLLIAILLISPLQVVNERSTISRSTQAQRQASPAAESRSVLVYVRAVN